MPKDTKTVLIATIIGILLICGALYLVIRWNSLEKQQALLPTVTPTVSIEDFVEKDPKVIITIPTEPAVVVTSNTPIVQYCGAGQWVLKSFQERGFPYKGVNRDRGVFQSIDSGTTVNAMCANPGWTSPSVNTCYIQNRLGVFIPVVEGTTRYQRFINESFLK